MFVFLNPVMTGLSKGYLHEKPSQKKNTTIPGFFTLAFL